MQIQFIYKQRNFLLFQYLLLAVILLCLIAFFPVGGSLDLQLISPWIDQSGHFPYRDIWVLSVLNHQIIKKILIALYALFFILWLGSFRYKAWKSLRWSYGYLFWVSIFSVSLIAGLKSLSAHACPWDMTHATYTGYLWDFSARHGHCFPGGHASAGFALISGYFAFRLQQTQRAKFYLLAGCLLGLAMGWGQMMRGAHFFSHNLWTGWIVWALNVFIYSICMLYKYRHQFKKSIDSQSISSVTQST